MFFLGLNAGEGRGVGPRPISRFKSWGTVARPGGGLAVFVLLSSCMSRRRLFAFALVRVVGEGPEMGARVLSKTACATVSTKPRLKRGGWEVTRIFWRAQLNNWGEEFI